MTILTYNFNTYFNFCKILLRTYNINHNSINTNTRSK